MDNVLIVVDDLDAAIAFFTDLGLELEGRATVDGPAVDRLLGLDGARSEIVMLRTADGQGIELDKFNSPPAVAGMPADAPVNTLGIRRIMFASTTWKPCLPACAAEAPSSSARSSGTRTAIGSATSAGPRA